MTVRFDISPEALQARARHAVADLRDRATEHVVNRIARQPAPVFQQARALTPEAEFKAKEAITMDDELAFLNPAPPPRPADAPLDDAALFPTGTGSAVEGGEAQVRHKKKMLVEEEDRDRQQATLELIAYIKRMTVRQLLDLKSTANVPPFFLTAAAIEKLVNLLIRLATLGLVRRVDTLGAALAARDELRSYAEAELDARRRTPATVADRKKALAEYAEAVRERGTLLAGRHSLRTMPDSHAAASRARTAADLRTHITDAFERRRASAGIAIIAQRRAEYNAAREAHRRARAENDLVPAGLTGLRITKIERDAATAAKAASILALKMAAERRATTKHQLQLLLDEVEAASIEREERAAEHAAAVEKAESRERDDIKRELRALPEQIREVTAAAHRAHHQERAAAFVAEHNRPRTPAELEAVEAERLRQLDLINRRG